VSGIAELGTSELVEEICVVDGLDVSVLVSIGLMDLKFER